MVGYDEFGMIHNPEYPFIFATLDGEIGELENDNVKRCGVLEIKTADIENAQQYAKWKENKMPDSYFCQNLHQLLATGYDFVILNAQLRFIRNGIIQRKETIYRTIERPEVEADIQYLLEREIDFWKHVQNDTKPNLILPNI
jgi:predicted phage-related endonuclease